MIETRLFDVQSYLQTPEERAAYLEAALDDGNSEIIARALAEIAHAVGIEDLSAVSGMSLDRLTAELMFGGKSSLGTFAKVTKALGLKLIVASA